MKIKRVYWNKRIIHRYLGYGLCIPLFLTSTTGFLYKISKDVFGAEKENIKFLLKIHQMSFLFPNSELFYTSLLGCTVCALVLFGYSMIYNPLFGSSKSFRKLPQSIREFHHRYSSVIFILLLFMALTGSIYRFCRNAIGIEKTKVHWLMDLHHMSFLPNWLSVIWIAAVYISILSLVISGIRLLPIVNNLFQSSNSYQILISNNVNGNTSTTNTLSNDPSGSNSNNVNSNSSSLSNSTTSPTSSSLNNSDQIINIISNENHSTKDNNLNNITLNPLIEEEEYDYEYSDHQRLLPDSTNNIDINLHTPSPTVNRNNKSNLDSLD